MNAQRKTPAQMRRIIEQVSESMHIELLRLTVGQIEQDEYAHKVAQWMRLLADNTNTERGPWEVRDVRYCGKPDGHDDEHGDWVTWYSETASVTVCASRED